MNVLLANPSTRFIVGLIIEFAIAHKWWPGEAREQGIDAAIQLIGAIGSIITVIVWQVQSHKHHVPATQVDVKVESEPIKQEEDVVERKLQPQMDVSELLRS